LVDPLLAAFDPGLDLFQFRHLGADPGVISQPEGEQLGAQVRQFGLTVDQRGFRRGDPLSQIGQLLLFCSA
jgi:hypothetical protein